MKHKLIILALFIASCSSSKKLSGDWWKGKTKFEIMEKMGAPVKSEVDQSSGKELLLFCTVKPWLNNSYYYEKVLFFLDSSGRAYARNAKNDLIPPDQIDLKVMFR